MKEGTEVKMWCNYYITKRKIKVYDLKTLAFTKRGSVALLQSILKLLLPESRLRIIENSQFEKVTVTIKKKV